MAKKFALLYFTLSHEVLIRPSHVTPDSISSQSASFLPIPQLIKLKKAFNRNKILTRASEYKKYADVCSDSFQEELWRILDFPFHQDQLGGSASKFHSFALLR